MPARRPEDLHRLFAEPLNAGDADAGMALYEPGASLVPQPGQVATGTEAIRAALDGFLALKGTVSVETRRVLAVGDLALLYGQWRLTGTAPDGSALHLGGRDVEVARRQPDGTWLYVIDDPYGDA